MINELYELARVLDDAQVKRQSWHPKYKPIPNIRQNAPCVRITVSGGKIADISSVSAELGKSIRKYGDNQGTYPCMNLAPLYRITDESVKRELADLKKHPEKIDTACICKMKTWCTQNNWGDKVQKKFRTSMERAHEAEFQSAAARYRPLRCLLEETEYFADPTLLHNELERKAWELLRSVKDTALALTVLFYLGKAGADAESDYGSLSVAFDALKLIDDNIAAVSNRFVLEVNEHIPMDGSQPYISSGTWSLLGVKTPKPITNTASRAANYSNEGGVGYNRYQKNIMGMWLVNELQREICSGLGFAEIVNAAKESRCDVLIDANAPEFLAPKSMKAAFDTATGGKLISIGDYFRCAYRSLAESYAKALAELERNTGKQYDKLYIVGGGAKNEFLNHLTAKATGKRVVALPIEATALGNLKTQMEADL